MTSARLKWIARWTLPAAAVAAACLVLAHLIQVRHMEALLLRTDDSRIARSAELIRFARARAAPAYAGHCASCHGADMTGDRSTGAPSLVDGEWLYSGASPTDIERTIAYGIRSGHAKGRNLADMPAFGRPTQSARYKVEPLAPQDVRHLVDYLLQIEGRGSPDPASSQQGAALFAGRGQCFDCHASDAEGDNYIGAPNLRDGVWTYGDGSRAAITQSILNGRAGACPAWERVLGPATIRALAVYIYARAAGPRAPAVGS
jgi:cytochrome c oxidase cbb3-type subunit 3